jgi:hypothetical protein
MAKRLVDLIQDADVLCALEPEELGLRMLPVLAESGLLPNHPSNIRSIGATTSSAPFEKRGLGWKAQPS